MTHHDGHDELQHVVARLRAERPEATPLELDAVKQRVRARAARPRPTTRRSTPLMRTRAAILSVLALGFLLSTAGAGLAVTGLQDNSQASQAQYPAPAAPQTAAPAPSPESQVLGEQQQSAPAKPAAPEKNQALPKQAQAAPAPAPVEEAKQLEVGAQAGSLPFTGFAALPILLLGLVLLSVGLVMRRSTGKE